MNKKTFIIMLLICIIFITNSFVVASGEKIYELKIKSTYYDTYYIYENELTRLNNNKENIIVYSSLDDLMDNKETIIKRIDDESLMEYTLFANSLDEIIEEEIEDIEEFKERAKLEIKINAYEYLAMEMSKIPLIIMIVIIVGVIAMIVIIKKM